LRSRPGRGGGVSQLTGPGPAAPRRLWVEALRIDPATRLLGLRVNIWTSLAAFTGAATWLIVTRPKPGSAATEASPD
jgi:hypothetical protein